MNNKLHLAVSTWLRLAHTKLDQAVFAAYGWQPDLSDDEILEKLLALNLERSKTGKPVPTSGWGKIYGGMVIIDLTSLDISDPMGV